MNDVIAGGDRYADASIRGQRLPQTGLTNQAFDELSALEGIKLMKIRSGKGRFVDTCMAEIEEMQNSRVGLKARDALRNVY